MPHLMVISPSVGFMVLDLGCRVWGSWFRALGFGFRVHRFFSVFGLEFKARWSKAQVIAREYPLTPDNY